MLKQLRKKSEGFTIIEVMIVLAIAGLILLIVFLAVPALQRNSRNVAIRNDAASVLSAMNEFITTNNGANPTGTTGNNTITGANGSAPITFKVKAGTTVTWSNNGALPANNATGTIDISSNRGCNATGTASVSKNRALAALFYVETGGANPAPQCVES